MSCLTCLFICLFPFLHILKLPDKAKRESGKNARTDTAENLPARAPCRQAGIRESQTGTTQNLSETKEPGKTKKEPGSQTKISLEETVIALGQVLAQANDDVHENISPFDSSQIRTLTYIFCSKLSQNC